MLKNKKSPVWVIFISGGRTGTRSGIALRAKRNDLASLTLAKSTYFRTSNFVARDSRSAVRQK